MVPHVANYNLQQLARRARPFRPIVPPASLAQSAYRALYAPILAAWSASAVQQMANYTAGDTASISQEDESTAQEVAQLIAFLSFWNFYRSVEEWNRRKWLSSVSNAAGVDVGVLLDRPSAAMPVAVNRQARRAAQAGLVRAARTAVAVQGGALVPSGALTGLDAVLANSAAITATSVRDVSNAARARVANTLFNGLQSGRPAEDVARDVAKGLAGDRVKARKAAEDQVRRASKAITKFRIEEAGFDEGQWLHLAGQKHPRPSHRARDKQVFPLSDPRFAEMAWPNCHCVVGPPPLVLKRGRGNAA